MFKSMLAGEVHAHPNVKAELALQIAGFNPLRRDNTDGILDLLTYAPKMIENFSHLITITDIIAQQEWSSAKVWDESETSCW